LPFDLVNDARLGSNHARNLGPLRAAPVCDSGLFMITPTYTNLKSFTHSFGDLNEN
jgi:hypothetical protein